MPDPRPHITQYNQFSCALASVVFESQKSGRTDTQEEIVEKYLSHFPGWDDAPGIMQPWEILKLLSLMGLEAHQFVATKSIKEAMAYSHSKDVVIFATFYWIRFHPDSTGTPTNHCMALLDVTTEHIDVMDPEPNAPYPRRWSIEQHQRMDGTFLLCACPKAEP